jgi:PadR family transcriptional regulator PadR
MIDRDFARGFIKLYVMARAAKTAVYGLQVMEEMNEMGFSISPGTLYPALHALEREGDVIVTKSVVKGKVRKCYRLTRKGREEFKEVKERLEVLVRKVF